MSIMEIPARDLARVLPFRGIDDVRYYLNGILVEPTGDGCMLVATNGHWIGVIHSKAARADKRRVLVMSEAFETAINESVSGHDAAVTVNDETSHAVLVGPHERYIEPGLAFIDGKFPEWRKVIPPAENLQPGLIAALQSKYLSALHKAAKSDHYPGVCFWHDDRKPMKSASVVRYSSCPELIVLVMPLGTFNDKSCEWPSWFAPPATEEATTASAARS